MAGSIALLSCARLVAAALIGPVAPVRLVNSAVASVAGAARSPSRLPKASARVWRPQATACLEPSDSGWLARSLQAVQNLPSRAPMPVVAGSPRRSGRWPSASALVVASPSAMFCARNCRSRKESRMRR